MIIKLILSAVTVNFNISSVIYQIIISAVTVDYNIRSHCIVVNMRINITALNHATGSMIDEKRVAKSNYFRAWNRIPITNAITIFTSKEGRHYCKTLKVEIKNFHKNPLLP